MEIPNYIDELITRREELADELNDVSFKLDSWLYEQGIDTSTEYTGTGFMVYTEPAAAADEVRNDILNKEENEI